jgi:hypothetical protein
MALRIHVPWALLLAVIGFAALGAGAAYLMAEDWLGQLYPQCAMAAAGAGLLGACGWFVSERVSYAANLNTSPFLRLTLPGVAAVWVAAEVVSPFTEFTAGSAPLWTHAAAVGLYVAAGILPMVAGVSLVAVGEALFAAQRGNAELSRTTLRPLLRYAGVGVLLGGVVVYSAIELRANIRDVVLAVAPERGRASGWLERKKALFTEILSSGQCDVLVLPFETGEAANARPAHSLDRPARSLMTRQVAAGIAAQTGLCVADPTLVSRALGPRTRNHDWHQILRLAEATGARWIVRGDVKLDGAQQSFDAAVQMYSREPGEKPRWSPGETTEWGPLTFTDELPPEVAFQSLVPSVVEHLGLPAASPGRDASAVARTPDLPSTPAELANDPGSPLARAQRLQLVAATYPPSDVSGEQLWERSLIAVAQLAAHDEAARTVRARAALHLYRRPYAVALLRGLDRPEAHAARALAQGNLFEAESLVPQMTDAVAALITEIELEAMRTRYGRSAGFRERRKALIDKYPAYAAFLYVPLSSDEWLEPAAHELVWRQLATLGVPVAEDAPVAVIRRVAAQFSQQMMFSKDIVRLPLSIERSYAPVWIAHAPQWRAARAFDRLAPWDIYDALYAANRAAVGTSARALSSRQIRPEAFLAYANALGQTFAGDPVLEEGSAWALGQLRYERNATPDRMLDERQRRLLQDLVAWGGGETETQRSLAWALPRELQRAYLDEPPRDWRAPPHAPPDPRQAGRGLNRADLESNLAHELRAMNFSQYDFTHVSEARQLLERLGNTQAAEQIAAHAQSRFNGSPARDDFLLKLAEHKRDTAAYVALVEQKVREQPAEWSHYYRLAQAQLQAREPQQAQRTLLAYPLWRGDKVAAAALSNQAQEGGLLLLRAGEGELARPLFKLAAGYQTGSSAELWSGLWLARLDHNWPEIRNWGRRLHQQHKDAWGLSDAAYASFLLGDAAEGWRTFYEASKQFEDTRPWSAAVAGHRIAATRDDELIGFAKHWKSLSGNASAEAMLRQQFVFNALMLDRTPGDKTLAYVVSTAASAAQTSYAPLATGYRAFKRGDYAGAIEHLTKLSEGGAGQSQNVQQQAACTLPYVTASLVKTGRAAEAGVLLTNFNQRFGHDFCYLLASAYLQGLGSDPHAALDSLWQAHLSWPDPAKASIPPPFQLLETCEKLYELTGDARYKEALLDLARRQRVLWPWSWAYAFEAKYAADPQEREAALGVALFLDPQSEHLAGFSEAQRKRAQHWFAGNNPFKKP